jgi:hypothetical protein
VFRSSIETAITRRTIERDSLERLGFRKQRDEDVARSYTARFKLAARRSKNNGLSHWQVLCVFAVFGAPAARNYRVQVTQGGCRDEKATGHGHRQLAISDLCPHSA